MGLEDELFRMFGQFSAFGKGRSTDTQANMLIMSMLKNMELDMLRKMRIQINSVIGKVERERKTAWRTEGIPYGATADYGELDPFKILGVDMNSSYEEVKMAYRKKAFNTHPDRGGSHKEMVKINAAWEAICIFKGWGKE